VHIEEAAARKQAQRRSAPFLDGDLLGPLHGVPLTIKSCIDVTDWPCAAGSLLRKENQPNSDAVLVRRLRKAGAIMLGNNTPEFLMAYETDTHLRPNEQSMETRNILLAAQAWEACCHCFWLFGGRRRQRRGGSIRVPAHFCGICGLKPTPDASFNGTIRAGNSAFGCWACRSMAANRRRSKNFVRGPARTDAGDALSSPVQF